jgi:hypothetical protein
MGWAPEAAADMMAFAEIGRELRTAVQREGGEVPALWTDVARQIGIAEPEDVVGFDGAVVAAAVRQECGSVDVVDDVMRRVKRSALAAGGEAPAPANRGFTWGAMAVAAVALVFLVARIDFGNGEVGAGQSAMAALEFASADEIVVDDLSYAENAAVFQDEGEGGALIIWVDEETL